MDLVKIPFKPDFKDLMLRGQKTATSRTKKYGEVGDKFVAFGQIFVITDIQKFVLGIIATYHYEAEGFDNPKEFEKCWAKLHPRKGFDPYQYVFYHSFKAEESA